MKKGWIVPGAVVLVISAMALVLWLTPAAYSRETSAEQIKETATAVSVEVVKPERKQLTRSLTLPGSFYAFEEAILYAKVAGYLKSISVDIGDRVQKGQVLAVLDVPELSAEHENARAELVKAKAALQKVEADLLRCKADLNLKQLTLDRFVQAHKLQPEAIALQEVDAARAHCEMAVAAAKVAESEIEVAKAQVEAVKADLARLFQMLEYTKIVAPFTGFVTRRYVHPGALIPQGTAGSQSQPVVALARNDILRFHCEIPEPEVPFLVPGKTRVLLHVDALPESAFETKVARVAEALNPKTRTMLTELDVPNPRRLLKPGMYANAEFVLDSNPGALVVPAAALLMESGSPHVLRVDGDRVTKVAVRTRADDGIQVEVIEGLHDTDLIVVGGKNLVRPGDRVVPHLKGEDREKAS